MIPPAIPATMMARKAMMRAPTDGSADSERPGRSGVGEGEGGGEGGTTFTSPSYGPKGDVVAEVDAVVQLSR